MKEHAIRGDGESSGSLIPSEHSGVVNNTDELVRLVNAITAKGWRTWKVPLKLYENWNQPVLIEGQWLTGHRAYFLNWQMYIMTIIQEKYPSRFRVIEQVKTQQSKATRGIMVLHQSITIGEVMHALMDAGLFQKEV